MRLLTKTTLYFITVSLFVFFFGGIGIYQLMKRLENNKVNQELYHQMHRFKHDITHLKRPLHATTLVSGGLIELKHVHQQLSNEIAISDTLIFDYIQNRIAPFKKLTFYFEKDEIVYKTSIYKSMIESNYLIEQVALIITVIIMAFLLAVFFLYRYSFGSIWSDFFDTVAKIQQFDLQSPEKLTFPKSMIIEFNQLNEVLEKMMGRISTDFTGLKEFSGNLTHEIQTPLAVIKSKAVLLMQDAEANEKQMVLAGEINKETTRISKLIKALGLFAKLDNNQFPESSKINISEIIKSKLELFEDFIELKKLKVKLECQDDIVKFMHPELVDILITNLIKNAVRHNLENGVLEIIVSNEKLSIKNSGNKLDFDPNLLFARYSKAKKSESLGIGLSIVKKICEYYNFEVSYLQNEDIHEIKVVF